MAAIKAWHSAGADLSTTDYSGRTALHIVSNFKIFCFLFKKFFFKSSSRGFDQLSEFLCNIGNVNPLIKDCYGRTAIDEALVASEEGRVGEIIAPNFQNILALFKTNKKIAENNVNIMND